MKHLIYLILIVLTIYFEYKPTKTTTDTPVSGDEGDLSIEELKEEENTISETEEDSTNNQ